MLSALRLRGQSSETMQQVVIGEQTLQRIRTHGDLALLIGEVVRLERRGRSLVGLCPFHKEKTPSFHVNPERGFYHCFGCGASGDAIKFLREAEGLSFTEAARRAAERFGIEILEADSADAREEREAARRRQELFDVSEQAAVHFERLLQQHPLASLARDELARRGVAEAAETLAAFRVGYAPYGWDGLATLLRRDGAALRAAESVGLLVPRKQGPGYYDRFRHRLMFAITDLQGRVVGFSGRALEEPTAAALATARLEPMGASDAAPAKYLNSPESPIYRKREVLFGLYQARQTIRQLDSCVLVEGNFDVVSLHARGVTQTVAPLGTAWTPEQGAQLARFTRNVLLLFDGDEAGRRALRKAREVCHTCQLLGRATILPEGVDPDALVRQPDGVAALRQRLTAARSLLEHLLDECLDGDFAATDPQAAAARVREAVELIASEPDPTVRAMAKRYTDTIAARLGVSDAATLQQLSAVLRQRLAEGQPTTPTSPTPGPGPRQGHQEIGAAILGALLDRPELFDCHEVSEGLSAVSGDLALAIAALRQQPAQASAPEVLAGLPEAIHAFAARRLAAPVHDDVAQAKRELLENVAKLERLESRRERAELVGELQRAADSGDVDQEMMLLKQQAARAKRRHGLA